MAETQAPAAAADEGPVKLANGHGHAPASVLQPGSPRDSSATAMGAAEMNGYSSDVSDFVREDDPDAAEPDPQQQLQQALERIAQLEDQNVALWQELQSGDGSGASSDAGSPTSRDAGSRHGSDGGAVAAAKARAGSCSQGELNAKQQELNFLQQRCMQFEVEVEQEFEELNAQLFKAQQKVHELQQLLNESESKRRQLESAKLMVEAKLQETGQQLMECEQQLADIGSRSSGKSSSKDGGKGGGKSEGTTKEGGAMESPGTPPSSARRTGTPFFNSILENELEQLKEENEGLIGQLMLKKMDLAELSENYSKVKRDLHRREAKDRAAQQKMSRLSAILGSDMSRMRSSSSKSQAAKQAAQ